MIETTGDAASHLFIIPKLALACVGCTRVMCGAIASTRICRFDIDFFVSYARGYGFAFSVDIGITGFA